MRKIPAVFCAALLLLPLFSCGSDDKGDGANHLYDVPLSGNPQSLDPQYANDPSSNTVIKNLYSGLVSADENGNISCCNALSYDVSEDGMKYTFKLRQDNFWFFDKDKNDVIDEGEFSPVVADDYIFALRRVLDPKMQSPYADYFSCIKNGSKIISGKAQPETAGISAPDDYTLEITLDYPSAEFLGMLASQAAFPCNEDFFLSTKGRYGLDDTSVMSNGPFYVRQWFYDPYGKHNILYMRRNEVNANELYQISPAYVSFTIQKSESDIRSLFKEGSIECLSTLSSSYDNEKYSVQSKRATTLGLIFNTKDKYFSNKNLRKALALSVNRPSISKEISGDVQTAYGIIPPSINLSGRSYRDLSSDTQFDIFDLEAAREAAEQAKKELNIASLEAVKILVNAETADSSDLHRLSQQWQEDLGIYIGIEDVTPEVFEKRIAEGSYGIALYPLKSSINSPLGVIKQLEVTPCLKYALNDKKYSDKLLKCSSVSDLIQMYTSAEKEIIDSFDFIPLFYKNSYLVSEKDNESISFDPFTGSVDYRLAQNFG